MPKVVAFIAAALAVMVLVGCSSIASLVPPGGPTIADAIERPAKGGAGAHGGERIDGGADVASREAIIEPGEPAEISLVSSSDDPALGKKRVELSFVDTDIREFARVFFSEVLQVPYLIDPSVMGTVTVRSGGKIDGLKALALARQALESVGSTIRVSDGVYRVTAAGGGGYETANLRTFGLNHIDAESAQGALQGLIQGRAEIVASSGSAITIRGDAETLSLVASMIAAIDVDRFRSASFALFPLKHGAAAELAEELSRLYQGAGVSGATILPIERINALLLIVSRPQHLEFARRWVDRLDQGPQNTPQVYVYQVKNREAEELAKLVQTIFDDGAAPAVATTAAEGDSLTAPGSFLGPEQGRPAGPKVTADSGSNKLVIRATAAQYALVEQALRRLDTPLSQVYVEATIAEVRLDGELSHGVRWFLEAGGLAAGFSDSSSGAVAPAFPGFNFSFQVPRAEVVISALESQTHVKIVSTPQLTVIDRETATIQVGDQVPVVTKSVQDASSGQAVIANDVTFRDTGVILKVTPQVRSSGEVLLEIEQEVSRVVPTTSSQIDSPTISQRKVASTVLVPDGTAIVLAGLISASDEESGGGVPGTKGTLLDALFGSEKQKAARSELIVILRPVIIRDRSDFRDVAAEVTDKMRDVTAVPLN